jgi:hypothetical protein
MGEGIGMMAKLLCITLLITLIFAGLVFIPVRHTVSVNPAEILFLNDNCEPPCLFDVPLGDASVEQLDHLLRTSWMAANIVHQTDSRQDRHILWQWQPSILRPVEGWSPSRSVNSLSFRDGRLNAMQIHFAIPLEAIIAVIGEPQFAVPVSRDQAGRMYLGLKFEAMPGRFLTQTNCNHPQLMPNTPVVLYESADIPSRSRFALPSVGWTGYTDALPGCIVFRP